MRPALVALLVFCGLISTSAQGRDGSLYLLAHDDGRWCGLRDEQLWSSEKASSANVLIVGRVDYASGRVAFVYVTTVAESGDWTTYDKYSFDKDEVLTSLERTIVIPDGLKQEQLWSIRNGHATEQKSTNRNLATNEIVPDGAISFQIQKKLLQEYRPSRFGRLCGKTAGGFVKGTDLSGWEKITECTRPLRYGTLASIMPTSDSTHRPTATRTTRERP